MLLRVIQDWLGQEYLVSNPGQNLSGIQYHACHLSLPGEGLPGSTTADTTKKAKSGRPDLASRLQYKRLKIDDLRVILDDTLAQNRVQMCLCSRSIVHASNMYLHNWTVVWDNVRL